MKNIYHDIIKNKNKHYELKISNENIRNKEMTPEEILNDASLNETSYGPNSHLDRVFNLDKSPSRLEEIITPHKFSSSTTFLEETISDIRRSGHEPSDIILIEAKSVNLVHTWTDFIKNANFKVVVDAVNSTGGIFVPSLLEALGVHSVTKLYCEPTGHFPHNPEPLPEHLTDLSEKMISEKADVGITVDPDVDRLALVCEDGSMFGEEYTLVAVADYVLTHTPGATVSNLSSTRALRDITEERGLNYHSAAVGEVNVVSQMKEVNAVIGGEGNGGIIYPELHYGRDSLVGIALFLSHLAHKKMKLSELRDSYPKYTISKNKIELTPSIDVDNVLAKMAEKYSEYEVDTLDGVKIYIEKEWVHLRKSNTEPIIRIYSESETAEKANELAFKIMEDIKMLS